jgi:hypothetical protein
MSWLVDNATVLCVLLICAALGWFAAWWTTRKRIFLISLDISAGLLLVVVLLTQLIVTDRQKVEQALRSMTYGMSVRPIFNADFRRAKTVNLST